MATERSLQRTPRPETRLEQRVRQLTEARTQYLAQAQARFAELRGMRELQMLEMRNRRMRHTPDVEVSAGLGEAQPAPGPSWAALAVGVAILAVVSVAGVILYLVARRKSDGSLGDVHYVTAPPQVLAAPPQHQPQVYVINAGGGQAMSTYEDAPVARIESRLRADDRRAQRIPTSSMLKTYRLPWLGDPGPNAQAIRIATSLDNPYEVEIRVVAPPGALAVLSFSQTELSNQRVFAPGLSEVPAGDVVVVPAGPPQRLRMNPRQVLFARGNLSPTSPGGPVVLSISATDIYEAK